MQGIVAQEQAFAQSDAFNIMEAAFADINHHARAGNPTFRQLVQMYPDRIAAHHLQVTAGTESLVHGSPV